MNSGPSSFEDKTSLSSNLVNSVILTLIARVAMIIATAALPVAGWMLIRVITTIDLLHDNSIENGGIIKMIQQNQQVQGLIIQDHESRVRLLEKR